jgi:hypothetical protein
VVNAAPAQAFVSAAKTRQWNRERNVRILA